MRKLFGLTAVSALMLALPLSTQPASAGGEATTCIGTLHAGKYHKVIVPKDAVCLSNGPVRILSGLWIQPGATFVRGSEESPGSTGTIDAGVHATDPASVQIHFATINGGLDIQGGSGAFGGPFDITWNAIEDNTIHGGVTVDGYDGFWFGFIRNRVSGTVTLRNNVL